MAQETLKRAYSPDKGSKGNTLCNSSPPPHTCRSVKRRRTRDNPPTPSPSPSSPSPLLPSASIPPLRSSQSLSHSQSQSESVQTIHDWLDGIGAEPGYSDSLTTATTTTSAALSSTPSAMSNSRGNARSNAGTSTSRSRSSSPSKLSAPNYRAQVLARANMRVDVVVSPAHKELLLPPRTPSSSHSQVEVDAYIELLDQTAAVLQSGAVELQQRATANEAEWQGLLEEAFKQLFRQWPQRLCCLPNRDWLPTLKPVAYTHSNPYAIPQKRAREEPLPAFHSSSIGVPQHAGDYDNIHDNGNTAATLLSNPPYLPPPSQPKTLLRRLPAASSFQPKTPRPDLSIGLADSDAAWSVNNHTWEAIGLQGRDIASLLADLQVAAISTSGGCSGDTDGRVLISDPCTASPSKLRFPFFIVEAKSGSTSPMVEAENQAAVSGASALYILSTLLLTGAEQGDDDQGNDSNAAAAATSTTSKSAPFKLRTYSLTTDGPTYTLWSHCLDQEDQRLHPPSSRGFFMVWLGTYRVTDAASARELIARVTDILAWGATEFKATVEDGIVRALSRDALTE